MLRSVSNAACRLICSQRYIYMLPMLLNEAGHTHYSLSCCYLSGFPTKNCNRSRYLLVLLVLSFNKDESLPIRYI